MSHLLWLIFQSQNWQPFRMTHDDDEDDDEEEKWRRSRRRMMNIVHFHMQRRTIRRKLLRKQLPQHECVSIGRQRRINYALQTPLKEKHTTVPIRRAAVVGIARSMERVRGRRISWKIVPSLKISPFCQSQRMFSSVFHSHFSKLLYVLCYGMAAVVVKIQQGETACVKLPT